MVADLARTATLDLLAEAVDDVLCRRLVRLDQLAGGGGQEAAPRARRVER